MVSAATVTVVVETTDLILAGSSSCFCYSAAAEITEVDTITAVAAAANFISTRCRLNQGTAIRQFPFLCQVIICISGLSPAYSIDKDTWQSMHLDKLSGTERIRYEGTLPASP